MSKSALYAGLGQGLMAAGQSFGRAFEAISLEKMRQENLQKNWAREDAIRQEDRAYREGVRQEENAISQDRFNQQMEARNKQIDATKENTQGLMNFRKDQADYAKSRDFAKRVIEKEGDTSFQVDYNAEGVEISRTQLMPNKKDLPENVTLKIKGIDNQISTLLRKDFLEESDRTMLRDLNQQRDKLLGFESSKQSGYSSLVEGHSADEVIDEIMKANPLYSRTTAIQQAINNNLLEKL
jgi:hypothetical protein